MGEPGLLQKQSASVIVTHLDPTNYRVAWRTANLPSFLLSSNRWQYLISDGDSTRYETIEVFGGLFSYFVKFLFRTKLQDGFRANAEALKQRAEATS